MKEGFARGPTLAACCLVCVLVAGCGSSTVTTRATPDADAPRLSFDYDASLPLDYVDRGLVDKRAERPIVHDVSFRSGRERIKGYLVLPPGRAGRPAVVLVHGSGGDRRELLEEARRLARRNVVALTITEPSRSSPLVPAGGTATAAILRAIRTSQTRDVVAVRRAVDVLQSLPQVDARRIGYLGWSAGARTGTFVAAAEPRVKALALLSAGAAPIAAYVAVVPTGLRRDVRRVLGSVDPIRYVALARPGSLLLEDGTRDEIVPHAALANIVRAAPRRTTVRWYDAPHALDRAAYDDAFAWLVRNLR